MACLPVDAVVARGAPQLGEGGVARKGDDAGGQRFWEQQPLLLLTGQRAAGRAIGQAKPQRPRQHCQQHNLHSPPAHRTYTPQKVLLLVDILDFAVLAESEAWHFRPHWRRVKAACVVHVPGRFREEEALSCLPQSSMKQRLGRLQLCGQHDDVMKEGRGESADLKRDEEGMKRLRRTQTTRELMSTKRIPRAPITHAMATTMGSSHRRK